MIDESAYPTRSPAAMSLCCRTPCCRGLCCRYIPVRSSALGCSRLTGRRTRSWPPRWIRISWGWSIGSTKSMEVWIPSWQRTQRRPWEAGGTAACAAASRIKINDHLLKMFLSKNFVHKHAAMTGDVMQRSNTHVWEMTPPVCWIIWICIRQLDITDSSNRGVATKRPFISVYSNIVNVGSTSTW